MIKNNACENCIHYEVCKDHADFIFSKFRYVVGWELCKHFKDKSQDLDSAKKWTLEVRSYYEDTYSEESVLVVYIIASCSVCGARYPNNNSGQVYSKTIRPPEGHEYDFVFDEEHEKMKALEEFKQKNNYNANKYCSRCGTEMEDFNYDSRTD